MNSPINRKMAAIFMVFMLKVESVFRGGGANEINAHCGNANSWLYW